MSVSQALAIHTGFDLGYLRRIEAPVEFPEGTLLYRSRAKVSPRDKTKARRLAQLLFELVCELRGGFRAIPVTLPQSRETPIEAAKLARSQLGLSPDTPIKNIMSVLGRAGVLVLKVPLDVEGLDGFSACVGRDHDVPTICLIFTPHFEFRRKRPSGRSKNSPASLCFLRKQCVARCRRQLPSDLSPRYVINGEPRSSFWPHALTSLVSPLPISTGI